MDNSITADVTVYYDYDRSHWNFKEHFTKYKDSIWVYHDCGTEIDITNSDLFLINTKSTTKRNLYQALLDYSDYPFSYDYKEEYEEYTIEELAELCISEIDFEDFPTAMDSEGIEFERLFEKRSTRGYSQGDYEEYILSDDRYGYITEKDADHYFWDAPVTVKVELDLNNTYKCFDRDELEIPEYFDDIDIAKKQAMKYFEKYFTNVAAKDKILAAIRKAFPAEINYINYYC